MFCMFNYKTFTEIFLLKKNKRSHIIQTAIHWIKSISTIKTLSSR